MGAIINAVAIVLGTAIGLLLRKGMSEALSNHIMLGLGLCTFILGMKGALVDQDTILMIVCISFGGFIGHLLQLEERIRRFAAYLQHHFSKKFTKTNIADGFVSSVLIFCVGAMAVMGSLESGLKGNHHILITKGMIDGIASIILASTKGVGVGLSAVAILLYEGGLTVLAQYIAPYLSESVIYSMSAIGSLLLVAVGLNIMEITSMKVMNFLPAMFLPILLVPLMEMF